MFSETVEYALRAIIHLAYVAPDARTTAQIAEAGARYGYQIQHAALDFQLGRLH